MLQIKNLSKSYGAKKAVSNLSFVVEDGDIMGFIGKNGAGKTTTLKACLGIIGIDEGEILLDGTSVLKKPMACKRKMAYVPDNPQLDEYMTGLQYLNFICDIYEVPSKMRKQNFEKLASAFQVGPHLNNLISSYSHGMKQKLALLLTALLLLTGCSSGGSGDTADGQDDGELETIDVVLDWYPNAVHAFLYEAEEKGYFAEEGLQVNILFPSNASDPLTMTAAGRADIGFYYQEDTIIARANEDVPVKVLGAVVQQPISIVCALAEKNIKTPEDLIGKTIGYSGTRFGEVAVGQMLETVGATLDDVELIDVGFDLMSAMTTGNVDATFGCFINHEVPALEEEGFAVDYMEVMDYGVPNYYALMLVTGEDQLEANRDKYTRFLRACQKGFADMQADPEEALGLLLANQDEENFPLTESVERRSFDVLLPIMETADAPFLSQDVSVWQENIDWLQKVGMIDAAFDPAEVMVDLLAE